MSRTAEPCLTQCDLCGLWYMANHREDEGVHRRSCGRWVAAVNALGHKPDRGHEREAAKQRGHDLLREADSQRRVLGAELVLRAWFDRSLAAAISEDYWRAHPTLPQYTAMVDLEGHFPEDVVAALNSGKIGGYAADVYLKEPPEGSPLLSAPRVILTPHLGASTAENLARLGDAIVTRMAKYTKK